VIRRAQKLPDMTPELRERFERRRIVVRRDIETANGEWYQDLKSELEWLDKTLTPKEGV
jgi:hypothetical protein